VQEHVGPTWTAVRCLAARTRVSRRNREEEGRQRGEEQEEWRAEIAAARNHHLFLSGCRTSNGCSPVAPVPTKKERQSVLMEMFWSIFIYFSIFAPSRDNLMRVPVIRFVLL